MPLPQLGPVAALLFALPGPCSAGSATRLWLSPMSQPGGRKTYPEAPAGISGLSLHSRQGDR